MFWYTKKSARPGPEFGPETTSASRHAGKLFSIHGVRGVDDDKPPGRGEQVPEVGLEDLVLDQVINNIQGDRQVSSEQARMIYKTSAVVKKKLFVRSSMKVRLHSSMAVRETSRPI